MEGVLALRTEHHLPVEGLEPLSEDAEAQLISFWLGQIVSICSAFKPNPLPKKVANAAVTFMQRFYLNRSCMLYDPQLITVVCVYVGAKVCCFTE